MMRPPRPGEIALDLPASFDAGVYFLGRVRTPWPTRADCPKNTAARRDVEARIELEYRYAPGLKDIGLLSHLIVLYWLHQSDRNLIIQAPSHAPEVTARVRDLIRKASPLPAPARLGTVRYTDTWLVDKSGKFQLDTLTEGQL